MLQSAVRPAKLALCQKKNTEITTLVWFQHFDAKNKDFLVPSWRKKNLWLNLAQVSLKAEVGSDLLDLIILPRHRARAAIKYLLFSPLSSVEEEEVRHEEERGGKRGMTPCIF